MIDLRGASRKTRIEGFAIVIYEREKTVWQVQALMKSVFFFFFLSHSHSLLDSLSLDLDLDLAPAEPLLSLQ